MISVFKGEISCTILKFLNLNDNTTIMKKYL